MTRSHLNVDGTPKRRYRRRVAERVAAEINQKQPDDPVRPYPCSYCKRWHVGRGKPWKRKDIDKRGLFEEIGERAFQNLAAENRGQIDRRLAVIIRRGRRA